MAEEAEGKSSGYDEKVRSHLCLALSWLNRIQTTPDIERKHLIMLQTPTCNRSNTLALLRNR